MFQRRLANLERSKTLKNFVDTQQTVQSGVSFDSTLDYLVAKLFFVDIRHLIYTKSVLLKNFHLLPSEVDRMCYWEYEYLIEDLNKQVKEENDNQQAQLDSVNTSSSGKPNMKLPNMPNVNQFNNSLAHLNKKL